jgi:quinoprotein glucose dehydrogenase
VNLHADADGRLIALGPENGARCTGFGNGTGQIDLWPARPT